MRGLNLSFYAELWKIIPKLLLSGALEIYVLFLNGLGSVQLIRIRKENLNVYGYTCRGSNSF